MIVRRECVLHYTLCWRSCGACVCEIENDDHDDDNDHHATMITSAGMRLPFLELGAERGKHGEVEPSRI